MPSPEHASSAGPPPAAGANDAPTGGPLPGGPSAGGSSADRAGALAPAVDPAVDLAAVFAALPGAAAVFAADAPHHTVLAASDALLAAAGRPRDAVVGRPLAEAFPTADSDDPAADGLASLRGSVAAAVRTGAVQHMPQQRYDLQRPDGAWEARYWDAVNVPVAGPGGAVRYVLHQTEDVTARVRGEQALARAEHGARALLARIADAYVVLDRDFRFVDVNPAAERSMRKTREELLGRSHWEVFPASYDITAGRSYRRVAEEGVELHFTEHYRYEGYDVHLEMSAYPTAEGGVAVFWRDVTGRLRAEAERDRLLVDAEAARAEAERRAGVLAAVIQSMPDAVYVGTMAGVTVANRAALDLLGYDTLSELNRGIPTLAAEIRTRDPATGRRLAPEEEAFVRALLGEDRVTQEVLVRHRRTGQDRLVHAVAMPVRDPGGAVAAAVTVSRDVTAARAAAAERERLLAESEAANMQLQEQAAELEAQAEALQATAAELEERTEAADRARAEAEAANRAKGDFLAVMSHEFRTPLNAIGGYAQLMELGLQGPVTPEQLAALGRIQRGQQHLLGLINAVLNYAKLEAGHVQYEAAAVPAAELLAEAAALVAPQARAKGLALKAAPCAPDLVARADPEKVGQVLLNLLSNAVKFTRGGGAVTVAGARAPDGRVALTVADTGRGIAADQLARIFEPFVQVDQRLTRAEEGTGLGLAISRDLARGMGGDLTAESTPGVGSTFTLTLPAA